MKTRKIKGLISLLFFSSLLLSGCNLTIGDNSGDQPDTPTPSPTKEWTHYKLKYPGDISGEEYGCREHWVNSKGTIKFTKPSVRNTEIEEAKTYDFSNYKENDPRYIIPLYEETDEFKSVLYDLTTGDLFYDEVPEVSEYYKVHDVDDLPFSSDSYYIIFDSLQSQTKPSYYVNLRAYDHVLYSWNEMKKYFGGTKAEINPCNQLEHNTFIDGTFALVSDITINDDVEYKGVNFDSLCNDRGFKGKFDGRGHKITELGGSYEGGLFGSLIGATIENLTIDEVDLKTIYNGAIAAQANSSKFRNLNININSKTSTSSDYGLLISSFIDGNNFEKVTVNANNISVENMLGKNYGQNNSFESTIINCIQVKKWGTDTTGNDIVKPSGLLCEETFKHINISLPAQDLILNKIAIQSLTLGSQYQNVTDIESILLKINDHEYNLGNNLSSIIFPQNLKTNKQEYGLATVEVNTKTAVYSVPVNIITDEINTIDDLMSLGSYYDSPSPIYGYYVFANDITSQGYTKPTTGTWAFDNCFQGVLDGRKHKISLDFSSTRNGLFGVIKNSTIKNLTIEATDYDGSGCLLAYYINNCVIQNVNFIIPENITETSGDCNYVISNGGIMRTVFNSVKFESNIVIGSLFHNYYDGDAANDFNNFSVVVPNLLMFSKNTETVSLVDLPLGCSIVRTFNNLGKLYVDLNKSSFSVNASISGTLQGVYWNSTKISDSLTINTSVFSGKIGDQGNIEIKYTSNGYSFTTTVNVILVTQIISNIDGLNNFLTVADKANGVENDGIYDGYFIMDRDINWNTTRYQKTMSEIPFDDNQFGKGFIGTFDGCGHSINNFSVYTPMNNYDLSAFITRLGDGGVVKNIAFKNVKFCNCSVITAWGEGTVENVYVSLASDMEKHYSVFGMTNVSGVKRCGVLLRDAIIDGRNDNTVYNNGFGSAYDETSYLYDNVLYLTKSSDRNVVSFVSDREGTSTSFKKRNVSLSYNNFVAYTNFADLLKDNLDEIKSWDCITYKNNVLKFGNVTITEEVPATETITSHNLTTDYSIVYQKGDIESARAAYLLEKELYKATGKLTTTQNGANVSVDVTDGTVIKKLAYKPFTQDANLIVIGNKQVANEAGVETDNCCIKTAGHSVFIMAKKNIDLLACTYKFMYDYLGYKAVGQSFATYNLPTTLPNINAQFDVAFDYRLSTNLLPVYSYEKMAINLPYSMYLFDCAPLGAPTGERFHNDMEWLPPTTYKSAHPKWYRDDGNEDLCWTAHGDANEYEALVQTVADRVYETFMANPNAERVCFGMEDINYCHCSCSACCKAESENGSYSYAGIKLLNEVTSRVEKMEGMKNRKFFVYLLSYYFMLKAPNNISLNDHVGIMFAPHRYTYGTNPDSASNIYRAIHGESIHSPNNTFTKNELNKWMTLIKAKNNYQDQFGFWFYNTMFKNHFNFMDTFESVITWLEYVYHVSGGQGQFAFVQGATGTYPNTAFETFKQYIVSRAMIEIGEKVKPYSSYANDAEYMQAVSNYLQELENDFFGITSRTSSERFIPLSNSPGYTDHISSFTGKCTFNDYGYYGSSKAASSMYRLYLIMRDEYKYSLSKGKLKNNIGDTLTISTSNYANFSSPSIFNAFSYFTGGGGSLKTYYRLEELRKSSIESFLKHYFEAVSYGDEYTGSNKNDCLRHIEVEGLCPIFSYIMNNSTNTTYGFGSSTFTHTVNGVNKEYNYSYNFEQMRQYFKSQCTKCGVDAYYGAGSINDFYKLIGLN